jgi:CheY-like chemotaxis protein
LRGSSDCASAPPLFFVGNQQVAEALVEVRVFLVEDLKSTQGLLRELFSALGSFSIVATVVTEAEANLWLEEHPAGWDLAVVDLVLEQGTGMGVIARARSLPAAGKVVVFSNYASPGVRAHCLRLGAEAVFDKSESSEFIGYCVELAERENSGP